MASAVPVVSILALLFPLLAVIPVAALQQPQALRPQWQVGRQWPVGQQWQRQAPQQQRRGPQKYDYLQLVLQNPRVLNRNLKINSAFTIHGLWPSNFSGRAVEFCNPLNYAIDLTRLLPLILREKLAESWPNASPYNSNPGFWKQEYDRHGSCTGLPPEAFFDKVNNLYGKINLNDVLRQQRWRNARQNGWRPQVWATTTIQTAIGKLQPSRTKILPLLLCTGRNGREPKVLKEVVICYNKQATRIINCSRVPEASTHCGPTIYIP